jgi:hypothetical protein
VVVVPLWPVVCCQCVVITGGALEPLPGTSKWNKVEHRLFSFISINWRGRPLTDYRVIVETIAATTKTGLTVEAVLDRGNYPTGVKISNTQVRAVPLTRQDFHGEWNYTIHCRPIT